MKEILKKTWENIKNGILFYPISTTAVIWLFIIAVYSTYVHPSLEVQNFLFKVFLSLFLLYILSLAVYLRKFEKEFYGHIAMWISFVFTLLFYYFLPDNILNAVQSYYIIITFIIAIFLLFLSTYNKNEEKYYKYILSLSSKICSSIVISLIIFLTWVLAFYSIETLFKLHFHKLYEYFAEFVFILFAWLYFIWEVSNGFSSYTFDKFQKKLLLYILIPAIFVYFFILIAYDIKLLANIPNWPSRHAPYLIIFFSIIWYVVYVSSYNLEEVKKYKKYFPILVLIQLPILFISIYLRVKQYDLTFNRYLLILITLYLLIISIYYIFSKRKSLTILFITAIWLFILSSIWPWSIDNLPRNQQEKNLIKILKNTNLLTWNQIDIKKLSDPSKKMDEVKDLIWDKIDYLCRYHNCEDVKILKPIVKKIKEKNPNISSWNLVYKVKKELWINSYWYFASIKENNRNIQYKNFHSNNKNIYTFWYSYIIPIQNENIKNLNNDGYFITADENGTIYLYEDKKLVWTWTITQQELKNLFNQENNKWFEKEYEIWNYKVKIILKDFTLKKEWDKISILYEWNNFALLKRK